MPTLLLLALACAPADPSALDSGEDTGQPAVVALEARRVGWHVAFDTSGVVRMASGWSTTSAEGRVVAVEGGHVGLYSASLVPCETTASIGRRALDVLGGVVLGRSALAGHGDEADPSALPLPVVLDLAAASPAALDELSFSTGRYCGVHHLLSAGTSLGRGLPESPDMSSRSLAMWGTVEDDGVVEAFSIEATGSWGELWSLEDVPVSGDGDRADITLRHDLGASFDGVDLLGDADAGSAVLRNLVEHTQVSVVRSDADGQE